IAAGGTGACLGGFCLLTWHAEGCEDVQRAAGGVLRGVRRRGVGRGVRLRFASAHPAVSGGVLLGRCQRFVSGGGGIVCGGRFGSLGSGGCCHRCGGPPRSPRLAGLRSIGLLRLCCCRFCCVLYFLHGGSSRVLPISSHTHLVSGAVL